MTLVASLIAFAAGVYVARRYPAQVDSIIARIRSR